MVCAPQASPNVTGWVSRSTSSPVLFAVDSGMVCACRVEAPATAQDHCWSANEVKVGHRMNDSLVARCPAAQQLLVVVKMSVEAACCLVV
jgi:hypothetical protein